VYLVRVGSESEDDSTPEESDGEDSYGDEDEQEGKAPRPPSKGEAIPMPQRDIRAGEAGAIVLREGANGAVGGRPAADKGGALALVPNQEDEDRHSKYTCQAWPRGHSESIGG
jgi:hypothetical protein